MATRKELTDAIGARYGEASTSEKSTILDEFVAATGYHRKHAIRALGEAGLFLGGVLRDRRPLGVYGCELQLRAQRLDAFVLQVHAATCASACSHCS